MMRHNDKRITVEDANRHGQQLFFANMFKVQVTIRHLNRQPRTDPQPPTEPVARTRSMWQRANRQLPLFYLPHDFRAGHARGFPEPSDSALVDVLSRDLADFATRHGWTLEDPAG
jgi:hypothetical protein